MEAQRGTHFVLKHLIIKLNLIKLLNIINYIKYNNTFCYLCGKYGQEEQLQPPEHNSIIFRKAWKMLTYPLIRQMKPPIFSWFNWL